MLCDELKVYVPQDGPWGLEPEEGGKLVEEETCYLKSEVDAAIAELKAKLEDVQASAYADSVDAGMENRRLKRALWLARASEASKEVNYWNCENESSYAIVDFNVHHETIVSYKAPHHRPYKWILIWEEVERKCRAMAERYGEGK